MSQTNGWTPQPHTHRTPHVLILRHLSFHLFVSLNDFIAIELNNCQLFSRHFSLFLTLSLSLSFSAIEQFQRLITSFQICIPLSRSLFISHRFSVVSKFASNAAFGQMPRERDTNQIRTKLIEFHIYTQIDSIHA